MGGVSFEVYEKRVLDLKNENARLRAALEQIRDTKTREGYHTRQAQNLQRIAEDALADSH